jgi:hypothetical protein
VGILGIGAALGACGGEPEEMDEDVGQIAQAVFPSGSHRYQNKLTGRCLAKAADRVELATACGHVAQQRLEPIAFTSEPPMYYSKLRFEGTHRCLMALPDGSVTHESCNSTDPGLLWWQFLYYGSYRYENRMSDGYYMLWNRMDKCMRDTGGTPRLGACTGDPDGTLIERASWKALAP